MKTKRSLLATLLGTALLGITLAGCQANKQGQQATGSKSTEVSGKITAMGSTALQPLAEKVAQEFQKTHPSVDITIQGGGSGTGLTQVAQGNATIGNSDIFAEQQTGLSTKKLVDHKVAVVGMTPVVNPEVGVKNLTMAQLKGIFTGKYTNWQQVGGKNQKIVVLNRAEGSGTRATFEAAVLKGASAIKSQEQDSNGAVRKIVATTPGAISYLAFSYVDKTIKAPSIDRVKPNDQNVTTNKWKIWSYEHMYTKGKPDQATAAFLAYMVSSKVQQRDVKALGYIAISAMKVTKNAAGKVTSN